jgi:hypothetical protein
MIGFTGDRSIGPSPRGIEWRILMSKKIVKAFVAVACLASVMMLGYSCNVTSKNEEYFGKTVPPERDILRYVTGDEPESLDPPISRGQP